MKDFVNIRGGLTADDVWLLYHKASGIQLCKILVNISRDLTADEVRYLYHKASGIQLCKILSISAEVLQLMKNGTCIIKRLE